MYRMGGGGGWCSVALGMLAQYEELSDCTMHILYRVPQND